MSERKDEAELREDDIRAEHQQTARPAAHWAYLFGVLGGGLVLMLALIAFLGGSA